MLTLASPKPLRPRFITSSFAGTLALLFMVGPATDALAQVGERPCPLSYEAEQCQRFQDRIRRHQDKDQQQPQPPQAVPQFTPESRKHALEHAQLLERIRQRRETRQQRQRAFTLVVITAVLLLGFWFLWPMIRRLAGGLRQAIINMGLSTRDLIWLVVVVPCVVWLIYTVWWKGVKLILWPLQKVWRLLT